VPGSASPLRPRKPPRAATIRTAARKVGGSLGGSGWPSQRPPAPSLHTETLPCPSATHTTAASPPRRQSPPPARWSTTSIPTARSLPDLPLPAPTPPTARPRASATCAGAAATPPGPSRPGKGVEAPREVEAAGPVAAVLAVAGARLENLLGPGPRSCSCINSFHGRERAEPPRSTSTISNGPNCAKEQASGATSALWSRTRAGRTGGGPGLAAGRARSPSWARSLRASRAVIRGRPPLGLRQSICSQRRRANWPREQVAAISLSSSSSGVETGRPATSSMGKI
jgi:hypothetical protein